MVIADVYRNGENAEIHCSDQLEQYPFKVTTKDWKSATGRSCGGSRTNCAFHTVAHCIVRCRVVV